MGYIQEPFLDLPESFHFAKAKKIFCPTFGRIRGSALGSAKDKD